MDQLSITIQDSLNKRAGLLQGASILEQQAQILRKQASTNDLGLEINDIQVEVFKLLDKIDLLNELITLACKLFSSENEFILISLYDYQNCSFQGRSIETIENELTNLTSRVVYLMDLLRQLCGYIGHDFKFIKNDTIFDLDGLEASFEMKQIHGCLICGGTKCLEMDEKADFDASLVERLEKLRKARKMQVYESKFKITDNLQR